MSLKRPLWLLVLLAFSNLAFAQKHGAPRGGGGAVHSGQQHTTPGGGQRPMTPQEHEYLLHYQMLYDEMMFGEMMRSRGAASRRQGGSGQSDGGQGQQSSGNNRSQTRANRQQEMPAQSPGVLDKPTKQEREKEFKEREAAAAKKRKEEENSIRRNEARKGVVNNRILQGSHQAAINLLKNAHSKMSRADHDYGGHRVRSREHVTRALEHLGATSAVIGNASWSHGNLPQGQSDELLRQAEFHHKQVLNTVGIGRNTLTYHHNARASVEAALRELRIALRIN